MKDTAPAGVLFASYNIHKCVGADGRFDPGRIAEVIGEISPDVIALQETDKRFGNRAGLLDLESMARSYGLLPVPVSTRPASHGWHGNLILVREALIGGLHQIKLPGLEPRGAIVADLDLNSGPVRVMAAHLGLLRRSRLSQVNTLLTHAALSGDRPVVLMGDLNEWRRKHRRSALMPLGQNSGHLPSHIPSYPSYFPVFALDRILGWPHHIVGPVTTHDTPLARVASDHLPIKAQITLS